MPLRQDADGRVAAACLVYKSDGQRAARYDKIHLFDADLPTGEALRESAAYQPGAAAVLAQLPGARLGLTVCYDMRFPLLYWRLAEAGAEVLTVPSAFTVPTGEAHWHVLLRARAIETGCFVLAAAQGGLHESGRATYGHSLAVNPWGQVIAEGGTEPAVILCALAMDDVAAARRRVPALANARPFALKPALPVATSAP